MKKFLKKPVIWVDLAVSNAKLILHRYQSLSNIINTSLFFLAMMQKPVEIVVGKALKRPPLNSCSRYHKLYLPKDIVIDRNQYKRVNLNFKIKVPENITNHIISNTSLKQ